MQKTRRSSRHPWRTSSLLHACYLIASLSWTSYAVNPEPEPIAVPVGTGFFGDDGQWSGVNIRVGPAAQAQWLTVFPNTGSQETWVIGPAGCDGTVTCEQKRGGLFYANESSTWSDIGFYELGFDPNLGDTGYGDYGLDMLAISDKVAVSGQIISVLNSTQWWLGQLGLGVEQTRFEGTANKLTFLSSLVENASVIPSHSYGYTAGAYYRLKTVPSSLTLGGVDTNRFVPNSVSFTLGPDQEPVVALDSITVSASPLSSATVTPTWDSRSMTLLDAGAAELHTIDSSTPFLWLPPQTCDAFAAALNLTYDDTLQLYVFSEGMNPDILNSWNLSFHFTLSDLPGSANRVSLTLPYDAFNLQLTYPYPNGPANFSSPAINYFPIRRAANDTQYTIGRAFLQEIYLTVDYERNNFSLSQAQFALDALTNIKLEAITRPAHSNYTGPVVPPSPGLSTGAKAGIGVGGAAAGLLLIALIVGLCCCFRRRANNDPEKKRRRRQSPLFAKLGQKHSSKTSSKTSKQASELHGDKRQPTEIGGTKTRFELPGSTPIEMPAAEVPHSFYSSTDSISPGVGGAVRKNQREPVELEPRNSISKDHLLHNRVVSSSTPPAYSPSDTQASRQFGDSISPTSPNPSRGHFGRRSDGEPGVSPVGHRSHSSSDNSNQPIFSPVSPVADRFTFSAEALEAYRLRGDVDDTSHHVPTRQDGHPRSPGLVAPHTHQDRLNPNRTLSQRSSRLVDEGLESGSGSDAHRIAPHIPVLKRKFSWEP